VFDEAYAVWGSGHNLTLPANVADPEKRDEAIQFIEWLAANSTQWAEAGQLPTYREVMESDVLTEMYGREAFLAMMPYEVFLPNIPAYNEIFASNAPTPMMVMAQSIMLEQADPATAVQTACDEITFILQMQGQ
jgi:multiple sugar transport system substrate-binding protein